MSHRKTLTAIGAVAATAFILAGCSTTDEDGGGGGDESETLTISWQSDAKPAMDAVIAEFKKANPNVDVNVTYAAPLDLQQAMRVQLAAGTYADVFWVWPGNGNPGAVDVVAPEGYLADLSDQEWVSQVPESINQVAEIDGVTYALMLETTSYGAMYNDQAMEAAGLEIPQTWSDLLQFCADAKAAGKIPFSMGLATPFESQNFTYTMSPQLVQGDNPGEDFDTMMGAGEITFGESGWTETYVKSQDLVDAGCFNEDFMGIDFVEANRLWAVGDAVGRMGIGVYLKMVETDATFTLAAVPTTESADENWLGYAAFGGGAVNAASENLDLAKKFLAFLGTPEMNALYVDPTGSGVPGTQPVLQDPDNPPSGQFVEEIAKYVDAGRTAVFPDQNWPNAEVQGQMYSGTQELFAGTKTIEQVLQGMQDAYDKGAGE